MKHQRLYGKIVMELKELGDGVDTTGDKNKLVFQHDRLYLLI
jgi:hypothetical protein